VRHSPLSLGDHFNFTVTGALRGVRSTRTRRGARDLCFFHRYVKRAHGYSVHARGQYFYDPTIGVKRVDCDCVANSKRGVCAVGHGSGPT
jgi:hypothetical protein